MKRTTASKSWCRTTSFRSRSAEIGIRAVGVPRVQSTVSLWTLGLDSELLFVGDAAYTGLMKCNVVVNWVRHKLGLPYWSLSMVAKHKVKNAVQFIGHYEEVVAHAARARGVDGVVCGHIHSAAIKQVDGLAYINCGDWVESCTALVEHFDGRFEIISWADINPVTAGAADANPDRHRRLASAS